MRSRSLLWAGAGVLLLASSGGAAEVGRLAGSFPHAGAPAPRQVSTRFVLEGVDLSQGVELPLTGGRVHLAVLSGEWAVGEVKLLDPAGNELAPGAGLGETHRFLEPDLESFDLPAHGMGVRLTHPKAGLYTLRGESPGGPVAVVVNEEGSALELAVQTSPLAARHGEPVTIEAVLAAAGQPVSGAEVLARVMEWERPRTPIRLAELEPGRYVATVAARPEQGLLPLTIRVEARGELAAGTAFARTALTAAMVAPGVADLDLAGVRLQGEALAVPVTGVAGDYRLEAIFGAQVGDEMVSLAFSREDFQLAGGHREVALPVPSEAAGAERLTLRLLDRNSLAVEREVEIGVGIGGVARPLAALPAAPLPASKRAERARLRQQQTAPPRQP